jgi:STE24 endopeptidase
VNEEKATRYHRLKRRAGLAGLAWNSALLLAVGTTGFSVELRDSARAAAALVGRSEPGSPLVVIVYVLLLLLIAEAGALPLAFYSGFLLERRYGLSNQRLPAWLADQGKGFVLTAILGMGAATIVYACIRWTPERWWLPAGLAFAVLIVGLANLAPVLLLPLFYRIKPLERADLRLRLLGLADRAGAKVLGAYELGLGDKTNKANAALAGLGSTRRILVSDTMLSSYSDDEIEVVLAHELAHHVHGDIWKGIAFETALMLAGMFVAAGVLSRAVTPLGFAGPQDVAGLPILLLAAGAVSVIAIPGAHALSRANERNADRFALEMTRNPAAFVSAMRRLGAQNLAEDDPSPLVQWLFYSHPPLQERIAAAQAFRAR